MANKMLIDATHPEETRVVVLRGSRVEEFDFESASKRQLRGNIYLAKVIRVEPSLQAAFVDYGGNRHGFLAFSEIHPDYYQIPVSDRQALLDDEAADAHEEEEEERRPRRSRRQRGDRHLAASQRGGDDVVSEHADTHPEQSEGVPEGDNALAEAAAADPALSELSPPSEAKDIAAACADEGEADLRPIKLEASQTPPYDDPTADLIEHASEVRSNAPTDDPDKQPVSTQAAEGNAPSPVSASAMEPDSPSEPGLEAANEHAELHRADADANDGQGEGSGDRDASPESSNGIGHGAGANTPDVASDAAVDTGAGGNDDDDEEEHVDQLGGDVMEEIPRRAYRPRRQYKIQEVIKRRQVLLVQVVKEERGNKGAALTTYLSLAGRYSVLMPNTARGGGISRKITDAGDRQRLKSIAQDLEVPDGMGVILRTAGAMRSKPEVKRDFEYLMRMWETVRETTLASTAPKLVYEEGSLIKRAIRDLYNTDVDEIVVAGEDGYREAKAFMRLLTPSHVKNVQVWRDSAPLFTKAGAETQLDAMFSSHVTLKSGGYLVINQTEALVAIDVNSGRSTREHNIEDTALRTNLEAADEVARQLRLRDLAGLIVVDFIDMEETRNNRAVERRIKDALKDDRARIQIGRISHFGLLEMSRQRIRTGVLEGSTEVCQHCAGAGMVRSTASIALHVLRLLEDALVSDATRNMIVRTRGGVALYVLNFKRAHLDSLEGRFGVAITFEHDEHLTGSVYCSLERGGPATGTVRARQIPIEEPAEESLDDVVEEAVVEDTPDEGGASNGDERDEPRRRRRRRGRGRDRESSGISNDAPQPADDALGFIGEVEGAGVEAASAESGGNGMPGVDADSAAPEDEGRGRRRRSRRGGRRSREADAPSGDGFKPLDARSNETGDVEEGRERSATSEVVDLPVSTAPDRSLDTEPTVLMPVPTAPATSEAPVAPAAEIEATAAPNHVADVPEEGMAAEPAAEVRETRPEPVSSELDPSRPKRSGWWQRAKATLSG